MNTYIVKSGQNLFDVAITLYGSIEGIFDLLTSNEEWAGQVPLSYETTLKAGDILNYNPDFVINNDIKDWLINNDVKVANGFHIYSHVDVKKQILQSVNVYNQNVISTVRKLYPNVWDFENNKMLKDFNSNNSSGFFNYIYTHYWGSGYTNIEYEARKHIIGEDIESVSVDENDIFNSNLTKTRMLIIQSGQLSSFSCGIAEHTILGIDWGDASEFEICTNNNSVQTFEHCYEDNRQHKITLYGNFVLENLDFRNLNGVYYPITLIKVKNNFINNFGNSVLNQLIAIENEQNVKSDIF